MASKRFTLDDFMAQMRQVRKLGPIGSFLSRISAIRRIQKHLNMGDDEVDRQVSKLEAIYLAMTRQERQDTDSLNGSRRRRIADGAGVSVQDVSAMMRQYKMSRELMQRVSRYRW